MIITPNDMLLVERKPTYGAIQYDYSGGVITARGIANKIGSHVDTVRKRLKKETADEILATGLKKRGYKPGRKVSRFTNLPGGE